MAARLRGSVVMERRAGPRANKKSEDGVDLESPAVDAVSAHLVVVRPKQFRWIAMRSPHPSKP